MEDVEEIKITFAEKKVKFLKNEKNDFVTRLNKTFMIKTFTLKKP